MEAGAQAQEVALEHVNPVAEAKSYADVLKREVLELEVHPSFGRNHPDTAAVLSRLGSVYIGLSKWKEARDALERSLEILIPRVKADQAIISVTVGLLSDVYLHHHQFSQIELVLVRYLEKAKRDVPMEHPLIGEIKFNMGNFYRICLRFEMARDCLEEAANIWRAALRPDHPRLVACSRLLAMVYKVLGNFDEGEKLLKHVIQVRTKQLGEAHLNVGTLWRDLGMFYRDIGRHREAISALEKAMEIMLKDIGVAGKRNPIFAHMRDVIHDVQRTLERGQAREGVGKKGEHEFKPRTGI